MRSKTRLEWQVDSLWNLPMCMIESVYSLKNLYFRVSSDEFIQHSNEINGSLFSRPIQDICIGQIKT